MKRFLNAIAPLVVGGLVIGCGGSGNDAAIPAQDNASTASTASVAGSGGSGSDAAIPSSEIATVNTARPALGCDPNLAVAFCPQRVVLVGTTVRVGGIRYESPVTIEWTLTAPAGSAASLSDATSVEPTFTADVAGIYHADLHLNGSVYGTIASVTVTAIDNAAPVASPGSAQNVVAKSAVTLDGSASSDADGDPLTYQWTLTESPAGSTAALSVATSARPTFTADKVGTYVWTLVVNDGYVDSTPATVTVTAISNGAPVAPVAVAEAKSVSCWTYTGPPYHFYPPICTADASPVAGHEVTLDGSGSTDANGDTLTYSWTLTSKPAGSAASITGSPTMTYRSGIPVGSAFFVADMVGTYVATLVVNDGKFNSEPANVSIIAGGAAFNSIPSPLPVSVPSYGFEAYSLKSLGDRITLAPGAPRALDSIAVVMSSSACETGVSGGGGNCATTANSAFDHPITINIYDDSGALLASRTQMFRIPYRQSADPTCADGRWKASDGGCYDEFAFKIAFDLHEPKVRLPDTFVYEVVYNTSTQGPTPLGRPGGYDFLKVGVYSTPAASPSIGRDPDVGYVRWNGSLVDKGAGVMAEVRVTAP